MNKPSAHSDPLRVQILSVEHLPSGLVLVTTGADDFSRPQFTCTPDALEDPGFLRMLAYGTDFLDSVYTTRRETAKDRTRRAQQ